jgi:HEAT repeat protein
MSHSGYIPKHEVDHSIAIIIKNNIMKLADKDGIIREKARKKLVKIGAPVIDFLAEMETHPKDVARWEAVKALSEIRDPIATPLLVNALEDKDGDVRWLAAEGLAALGKKGVKAVLEAMLTFPDTILLRKGAHHVLARFAETSKDPIIGELLQILNDPDADLKMPLAVRPYLEQFNVN